MRIEKTRTILKGIIPYICSVVVSAGFLLAFSLWTSPAYTNWYGCDASFFTLVGRMMLSGRVPYRDVYDLKGPYFFFIQALGQLIKQGHTGIFILQVLALSASLLLIYKLGRLYISWKKSAGVIIFFLLAYISLLWGGNCLEEFTLPLNLLVIYLNILALGDGVDGRFFKERGMYISAAVTGLCFTVMSFSKVTAGAPLIGLCIGIFILMMKRRQYREFGFYLLYFILGAFIGLIPLLIYFGCHNSLLKMLYCTFVFGFKRSSDFSKIFSLELEAKVAGITFAIVFSATELVSGFIREKKNKKQTGEKIPDNSTEQAGEEIPDNSTEQAPWTARGVNGDIFILILSMSLVTYPALHLGDGFIYYFITGMPCMILALILFLKVYDPLILFKDIRQTVCWLLIFVFVYNYTGPGMGTFKAFINRPDEEFQQNYYRNSLDMGTLIPKFDRDRVFSFDIDMQWYEINGILPCNKYMVNLQYFIALEPEIEQELFDFFEETPPKWVICSNTLPDYLPQMDEMVRAKYDCVYTTDVGLVYLIREE